ncbi:MAG: hypothetical protein O7C63_03515 [Alphaproteobacteria bacterium]|nr:hypothetical protein [Alphaproteobacteria bacterium]
MTKESHLMALVRCAGLGLALAMIVATGSTEAQTRADPSSVPTADLAERLLPSVADIAAATMVPVPPEQRPLRQFHPDRRGELRFAGVTPGQG